MNFVTIEMQKLSDGNIATLTFAFATQPEAESKFYSIMAVAALSDVPIHSALVVDAHGGIVRSGSYTHELSGGE